MRRLGKVNIGCVSREEEQTKPAWLEPAEESLGQVLRVHSSTRRAKALALLEEGGEPLLRVCLSLSLLSADLLGANAVCVQAVVPGAHVHEHRTTDDECIVVRSSWSDTVSSSILFR